MAHDSTQSRELNLGMFKAYDIRTKTDLLDDTLSRRLVLAVGRYFQEVLKVRKVLLGRDARLGAPKLMQMALDILPELGMTVLVNPLQESTCLFYYSCMQNTDAAAVMFTASHNPGGYIGLKLLAPSMQPIAMGCGPAGGLTCIQSFYLEDKTPQPVAGGAVKIIRYLDSYVDYSMRLAGVGPNDLAGVPVLADFLCGGAGVDVAMAFDIAGAKLKSRNLVPDGQFPAGDPNPIIISSIQPTWDEMKRGGYAFGFCYDGDGDRVDLMDSRGEQVAPGFNMAVLAPELKAIFHRAYEQGVFTGAWNPQIYSDVKAIPTAMVDLAKTDIGVHLIRNGHSFIKEKLLTNFHRQYLAASEESAHYYMNFPLDSGDWRKGFAATENTLFFTMLTARMWSAYPEKYERMIEHQREVHRVREWPCFFSAAPQQMEQVLADVEHEMVRRGASLIKTMDDGSDLDAALMRFGLPQTIDASTKISGQWCQVAHRISRSEDAMTRWEVVAGTSELCEEMNAAIHAITDRYVAAGYAHY
jgi:phosphomannomutase